ncbi:MAG: hypothetical protein E7414_01690 [Ruminococcaceae bacterium]|nr:hypothetical protein [Oscillospiraceae bacterium]
MDTQFSQEVQERGFETETTPDYIPTQANPPATTRLYSTPTERGQREIPLPESPTMGDPQNLEQAYQDSFQAVLANNLGYYMVIEFLIGTSNLTEKEGILYAVGNNFVTLYEAETNRYIVCDLYSVKFVTIYNQTTRPRSRMNNTLNRTANSPTSGGMGRRLF